MRKLRISDCYEQLYRLSNFRLNDQYGLFRRKKDNKLLYEIYLKSMIEKSGFDEKSISNFMLGDFSNKAFDQVRSKLLKESSLTSIDYENIKNGNLKILKIFYAYVFFELYLSIKEDQRIKIDKVLFRVSDKKKNKKTFEIYRDVTLLSLLKETERILKEREVIICNITSKQFQNIIPSVPFESDVYTFLNKLASVEDKINEDLNNLNYLNNCKYFSSEDSYKVCDLLRSILKAKVFLRSKSSPDFDVEVLFKKFESDLKLKLTKNEVQFIRVESELIYFGSKELEIYFNRLDRGLISNKIKLNSIQFKKIDMAICSILKNLSKGHFKYLNTLI